MQVIVEEFEDGFQIKGKQPPQGATVDSFGDHRIAMAFAIAALIATGQTQIANADAASVSLPEFYELLNSIADCGLRIAD